MHAFPANDTWQGKRNSECWVVTADRNYRPLIAQYHLSESRGDHSYAILAGPNTFNDRDVRVTHLTFEFLTHRLCWEQRFLQHGAEGLDDAPRSGRPPVLQPEKIAQIVYKTTQETPS